MTTTRACPALLLAFVCLALSSGNASAEIPALPAGAKTLWVVGQPEEIVIYVAFDPATVADRLPPALRFITVAELATGGVGWASDFLTKHPSDRQWGISFFEIVRAQTFELDGRMPAWPKNGAAALWCARVAPADSTRDLGPGRPLLVLDFWVPDSSYASYMREKGHYATYADVRLRKDSERKWRGTVSADGLNVVAACLPAGPVVGGGQSAGSQIFFPPRSSSVTDIVRVAFAGHRAQECAKGSSWSFQGSHPLARGIVVEPSTFEYGYDLNGGAYSK